MTEMAFSKAPWRTANLAWMRAQKPLWSRDGKLSYAYMEMLGLTGNEMYDLLKPMLPKATYFHGVDRNAACLMKHVLDGVPFGLEHGDFFSVAFHRLQAKEVPFAVFNFDTVESARLQWWRDKREVLRDILRLSASSAPVVTLIFNHVLDAGFEPGMSIMERVERHARGLCETFSGWGLNEQTFLRGTERLKTERNVTGALGGFELYRSEGKDLRMITIRLAFDSRRKVCRVERRDS